jgi:hypothetical protein
MSTMTANFEPLVSRDDLEWRDIESYVMETPLYQKVYDIVEEMTRHIVDPQLDYVIYALSFNISRYLILGNGPLCDLPPLRLCTTGVHFGSLVNRTTDEIVGDKELLENFVSFCLSVEFGD